MQGEGGGGAVTVRCRQICRSRVQQQVARSLCTRRVMRCFRSQQKQCGVSRPRLLCDHDRHGFPARSARYLRLPCMHSISPVAMIYRVLRFFNTVRDVFLPLLRGGGVRREARGALYSAGSSIPGRRGQRRGRGTNMDHHLCLWRQQADGDHRPGKGARTTR